MRTEIIKYCKKFNLLIVFLAIELVVFLLRYLSVIDFELFKALSFCGSLSIVSFLEAWQAYRNRHINKAKTSLVFGIIFFVLAFI